VVEKHQSTLVPVHHTVIVQWLARISGDSVLANNDCRYLLSLTVRRSYQLFELLGELQTFSLLLQVVISSFKLSGTKTSGLFSGFR